MKGNYQNSHNAINQPLLSKQNSQHASENIDYLQERESHVMEELYERARTNVTPECCKRSAFYLTPIGLSLLATLIAASEYAADCPDNNCGVGVRVFFVWLTSLTVFGGLSRYIYKHTPDSFFRAPQQPEENASELRYVRLRDVQPDLEGRYPTASVKEQQYPLHKVVVQTDPNEEKNENTVYPSSIAKQISHFNKLSQPEEGSATEMTMKR